MANGLITDKFISFICLIQLINSVGLTFSLFYISILVTSRITFLIIFFQLPLIPKVKINKREDKIMFL